MQSEKLDQLSRDFLQRLLEVYPEWAGFVEAASSDTADTLHLVVKVPCPVGADCALEIRTENNEVTVHFDAWHSHFHWPPGAQEAWSDPILLIAQILNEDVRVASIWDGDKWRGAELLDPGEEFMLRSRSDITPDRLRVRSWRGTYNRDEAL